MFFELSLERSKGWLVFYFKTPVKKGRNSSARGTGGMKVYCILQSFIFGIQSMKYADMCTPEKLKPPHGEGERNCRLQRRKIHFIVISF